MSESRSLPRVDVNVHSLARGDSHMIQRVMDLWNASIAERKTWPTPWDGDYETREVSLAATEQAAGMLAVLANYWARRLLAQAGVGPNDRPPPTSAQRRRLVRLLNEGADSRDDDEQVLSYWASLVINGQTDQLVDELLRLAGSMRDDILIPMLNRVRATSDQFNGSELVLLAAEDQPVPPIGTEALRERLANKLKDRLGGGE